VWAVDGALTLLIGPLRVESNSASAILKAKALIKAGADIVSVIAPDMAEAGPRATKSVVFEVIAALAADGVLVGVETSDADTALTAASLGASVVLDPSGGRADILMAGVVSGAVLTFIANVLPQAGMGSSGLELAEEIAVGVDRLLSDGVLRENLVIDLGVGLAGEPGRNWMPLSNIEAVMALGHPVMVAASRPALLNALLSEASTPSERDAAVLGVSVVAFGAGAWAVRVDDVARIRDSVKPIPIGHADHSFNFVATDRRPASHL
jgi:dihydropteroate synthase